MKRLIIGLTLVIAAVLVGAWLQARLGWFPGTAEPAEPPASKEPEILYWVAPMDPNYRRDGPGKSPMGMDLVPVYADESAAADDTPTVRIDPQVRHNLGVRTALAEARELARPVRASAAVTVDEERVRDVSVLSAGWVRDLRVAEPGVRVKQGDPLFRLWSPQLENAQREYLAAARRGRPQLLAAAAAKLASLGMAERDLERLAERDAPLDAITVAAPQRGIVLTLNVREGQYLEPGTPAMTLADLSEVWMIAEVFAPLAGQVTRGQQATARLETFGGEAFEGTVDYVYPVVDPATRTLRVRIRFANPDERLKPNMYATVELEGNAHRGVAVPREAVIRAPGADRVVVERAEGEFRAREVVTGIESGGWLEIVDGLAPGERVVTSAQFLIDSEASITGALERLGAKGEAGTAVDHGSMDHGDGGPDRG